MSRLFLALFSVVLLSGCALLPPVEKELPSAPPESTQGQQQELDRYLDGFLAGGDSAVLDQYLVDVPDNSRYKALRRLVRALKQCRADRAEVTAELESGNLLVADLQEKNHHLRETIEQLKSLLIQLEQRAH